MKQRQNLVLIAALLSLSFIFIAASLREREPVLQIFSTEVQIDKDNGYRNVIIDFTFLDRSGTPVKGLRPDDVTVTEDDQPVAVQSLEADNQRATRVLLLLDTSGSMVGSNIQAAREAALAFVRRLRPGDDQIAILAFDNQPRLISDFTSDISAASDYLTMLKATPDGGTCLYDALWQATSMIENLAAGRYTIILLTDGRDEIDKHSCSTHTLDETTLHLDGITSLTLYTIGLGKYVDEEALERLATAGHGIYLRSPTPNQLQALFNRIEGQMRFQYTLTYHSTAPEGWHRVALNARAPSGLSASTSTNIEMPPLPYTLLFVSPKEGDAVKTPSLHVEVKVVGDGPTPAIVRFFFNGEEIGHDTSPPFELDWTPPTSVAGNLTLTAVSYDQANQELAQREITFAYSPQANASPSMTLTTISPSPTNDAVPASSALLQNSWLYVLGAVAILLVIVGGIAFLFIVSKRHRSEDSTDDRIAKVPFEGPSSAVHTALPMGGATIDDVAASPPRAFLIVQHSDDPLLIGRRLEITQPRVRLGRRSDNDITFPRDRSVSRYHAVIEERDGQFFLSEVIRPDASGHPRSPKFGTFVNDVPLEGHEAPLHHGAVIRLGPRLKLEFRLPDEYSGDDMTMDFTETQHQESDATRAD